MLLFVRVHSDPILFALEFIPASRKPINLFLEMYVISSQNTYLSLAKSKFKAVGEQCGVQTWFGALLKVFTSFKIFTLSAWLEES